MTRVFNYLKKYFLFDNESITGGAYFIRWLIATILIPFFGIGLWIMAATAYKRAGAFRWDKNLKIISAILILGSPFSALVRDGSQTVTDLVPLPIQIFIWTAMILHLILWLKKGNDQFININEFD